MIYAVITLFIAGYFLITVEQFTRINKAAIALISAVLAWAVILLLSPNYQHQLIELESHLASISGIAFFLLGAMTIVEIIDAHNGFDIIIDKIKLTNKSKLVWVISSISFLLSAVLDNLTTSIVMVSIIGKLIKDKQTKWLFLGLVIISANAGGAWSPIGDVTTTMLWIGGQISPLSIIKETFFASLTCMILPTILINYKIKGPIVFMDQQINKVEKGVNDKSKLILFLGIAALLLVPILKYITHLPPYMCILFSLGIIWVVTELIHYKKEHAEKVPFSVSSALTQIDTPSILFFLGILLSVASLETIGVLNSFSKSLDQLIVNPELRSISIGALSSVIDNVPLVAAVQSMYTSQTFPMDHHFWQLLAYSAGTGGSCLIIGSAAGVAIMGIEKISFFWYLKNISWIALIGFLAGACIFILQNLLIIHYLGV